MNDERLVALRAALRDLELGSLMLQDPVMSADTIRYAKEVYKVASAALKADDAHQKVAA